jgi:hypothetical protein
VSDARDNHKCFGCGRMIRDHEPHIHVPLSEWATKKGLDPTDAGLDDLLTFPFCPDCTVKTDDGWSEEQHTIPDHVPAEWQ